MSIYAKEKPVFFNLAMESIYNRQTSKPSEIILVQDGPLTDDLYESINQWSAKLTGVLKVVVIKDNVGLGDALNLGLMHCSNELVARMDTDDICEPYRFESQLKEFSKDSDLSVCGSNIKEFDDSIDIILSERKVPQSHIDIMKLCVKFNPFNHMTVMYKKSHVVQAGGYRHLPWMEDWYLWLRMLALGFKGLNLPQSLVYARTGSAMIARRSGIKYVKSEWEITKIKIELQLAPIHKALAIFLFRSIPRIVPRRLLMKLYMFARNRNV